MILKVSNIQTQSTIAVPKITKKIKPIKLYGIYLRSKELIIEFEDISRNRRDHLIKWHSNFCSEENYLLDQCPLAKEIRLAEIGLVDYWILSQKEKERI